ncbi:hypothetical protein [Saccharothrix violaceirubra]|uniref:Uncharacterized protein n=1 Tax=Saccharothrix violaceirubra TaxID=413306 RepID=A0A7W7T7G5_9PSEU|nr:hypothetical protein [Saccharothrix violaceirubra]MBB4967964.1 hypothetical protein [Saccharothrix violaceirubra]
MIHEWPFPDGLVDYPADVKALGPVVNIVVRSRWVVSAKEDASGGRRARSSGGGCPAAAEWHSSGHRHLVWSAVKEAR